MADGEPEVVEQFHGILACGTLGGRLIKDKTFFFSYEGLRLRLPQVAVREVPSLASRQSAPKRVGMKLWLEEWHCSQHINNSEKETPK